MALLEIHSGSGPFRRPASTAMRPQTPSDSARPERGGSQRLAFPAEPKAVRLNRSSRAACPRPTAPFRRRARAAKQNHMMAAPSDNRNTRNNIRPRGEGKWPGRSFSHKPVGRPNTTEPTLARNNGEQSHQRSTLGSGKMDTPKASRSDYRILPIRRTRLARACGSTTSQSHGRHASCSGRAHRDSTASRVTGNLHEVRPPGGRHSRNESATDRKPPVTLRKRSPQASVASLWTEARTYEAFECSWDRPKTAVDETHDSGRTSLPICGC